MLSGCLVRSGDDDDGVTISVMVTMSSLLVILGLSLPFLYHSCEPGSSEECSMMARLYFMPERIPDAFLTQTWRKGKATSRYGASGLKLL